MHAQPPLVDVLVVEDDADTRDAIVLALTGEGYTVFTAPDGMSALDRLRSHPARLVVLLDWMLPGIDGRQVLQAMASEHPPTKPHQYIFMSAAADSATFLQLELPPDLTVTIMAKPFSLDRLFLLVAQAAERARAAGAPAAGG